MLDASVVEWKLNVQNFVPILNFICQSQAFLWHVTSNYFCSLDEKLSSQSDYFSFNQRWVVAYWMAWRKNEIDSLH